MVGMKHQAGAELQVQQFCSLAQPYMPQSKVSKSYLLVGRLLLTFSPEVLVDIVDVVLHGSGIDEKFLGLTLFALVPNTTEFMNAMSFALNGNIALRYVTKSFCLKSAC